MRAPATVEVPCVSCWSVEYLNHLQQRDGHGHVTPGSGQVLEAAIADGFRCRCDGVRSLAASAGALPNAG